MREEGREVSKVTKGKKEKINRKRKQKQYMSSFFRLPVYVKQSYTKRICENNSQFNKVMQYLILIQAIN